MKWLAGIVCALFGGVAGAAMTLLIAAADFDSNVSYADLIATLLTALAVILTVLALAVSVVGILGWQAIRGGIERSTLKFFKEEADGGVVERIIREEVNEFMLAGIDPYGEENGAEPDDSA